jgi:hypothetical protein
VFEETTDAAFGVPKLYITSAHGMTLHINCA